MGDHKASAAMDEVKILLIEDSSEYEQLLYRMAAQIEEPHFTFRAASSLNQGLALFRHSPPDLVLLDLHLGDSEGYDTFARMRRIAGGVPIVVLSGMADLDLARRTVAEGAQDYLVKTHLNHHWLQRSLQYALERNQAQELLRRAYAELEDRVQERTAELRGVNAKLEAEVNERRKTAEALHESNRQLARAMEKLRLAQPLLVQRERLQALGDMSGGVVHDFNNKLAPILGFTEMLLAKPEILQQAEKARGYFKMIHEAATQASAIVERLQAFHGRGRGGSDFVPIPLNDVIDEAIALTQVQEKKAGHPIPDITFHAASNLPTVVGLEDEVRDMLQSVLLNAVDATREKGLVVVRTKREADDVVVEIVDTGIGMNEEALRRCLEPFYSTKSTRGTGFGLSVAYGIIRRHDGSIDISSQVGKGTTVAITFPSAEKNSPTEAMSESPKLETKLNILVVEDEDLVCEVLSIYLMDDGHTVETAENGRVGLEKFQAGTFDVVLTDRSMPLMGGDQLAREIKKLKPATPVILLTGFGDMMNEEGDLPEGVDQVVGKPFTISALRGALQKAVPQS